MLVPAWNYRVLPATFSLRLKSPAGSRCCQLRCDCWRAKKANNAQKAISAQYSCTLCEKKFTMGNRT